MALTRRRFSQSAEALAGCPKTTSKHVYFPSKSLICQEAMRTCFWNNISCYPNNGTSKYHYDFEVAAL
ncbi:hypothetical protein DZB77_08200 [Salmonella enterica]|nr:hypothetical protein [Salmonella enterica]EBM4187500.1 hypothetical protein [Salmonella enterica]